MVKLPKYFWIALLFCLPTIAFSAPLFSTEVEGIRIVLTDEPCAIPQVSNLKYRATWTEKGQTFEGCFGPRPDMGVVMFYWADKTVVAIPIQQFVKVVGV